MTTFSQTMQEARNAFYPFIRYYFDHSHEADPLVDSLRPLVKMLIVADTLESQCSIQQQPISEEGLSGWGKEEGFVEIGASDKPYGSLSSTLPLRELILMGPRLNIKGTVDMLDTIYNELGPKDYHDRVSTHGFKPCGTEGKGQKYAVYEVMSHDTKCKGSNINVLPDLSVETGSDKTATGHTLIHYDKTKNALMFNLEYSAPNAPSHGIGQKTSVAFGKNYIDDMKDLTGFPDDLKGLVRQVVNDAGTQIPYYGLLNVQCGPKKPLAFQLAASNLKALAFTYPKLLDQQIDQAINKIKLDPGYQGKEADGANHSRYIFSHFGQKKFRINMDDSKYNAFIGATEERAGLYYAPDIKHDYLNITKQDISAGNTLAELKEEQKELGRIDALQKAFVDYTSTFDILNAYEKCYKDNKGARDDSKVAPSHLDLRQEMFKTLTKDLEVLESSRGTKVKETKWYKFNIFREFVGKLADATYRKIASNHKKTFKERAAIRKIRTDLRRKKPASPNSNTL